jgi:hypothetical protein
MGMNGTGIFSSLQLLVFYELDIAKIKYLFKIQLILFYFYPGLSNAESIGHLRIYRLR